MAFSPCWQGNFAGMTKERIGAYARPKIPGAEMAQPSYVHGASSTALIGETIGVHFDKVAGHGGERDALISRHQGIRWSYRALKERVDGFAAGLVALGLRPGERVGIWSPNNA